MSAWLEQSQHHWRTRQLNTVSLNSFIYSDSESDEDQSVNIVSQGVTKKTENEVNTTPALSKRSENIKEYQRICSACVLAVQVEPLLTELSLLNIQHILSPRWAVSSGSEVAQLRESLFVPWSSRVDFSAPMPQDDVLDHEGTLIVLDNESVSCSGEIVTRSLSIERTPVTNRTESASPLHVHSAKIKGKYLGCNGAAGRSSTYQFYYSVARRIRTAIIKDWQHGKIRPNANGEPESEKINKNAPLEKSEMHNMLQAAEQAHLKNVYKGYYIRPRVLYKARRHVLQTKATQAIMKYKRINKDLMIENDKLSAELSALQEKAICHDPKHNAELDSLMKQLKESEQSIHILGEYVRKISSEAISCKHSTNQRLELLSKAYNDTKRDLDLKKSELMSLSQEMQQIKKENEDLQSSLAMTMSQVEMLSHNTSGTEVTKADQDAIGDVKFDVSFPRFKADTPQPVTVTSATPTKTTGGNSVMSDVSTSTLAQEDVATSQKINSSVSKKSTVGVKISSLAPARKKILSKELQGEHDDSTPAYTYHTRIAAIYSKHCPEKLKGISSLLRHKQVKGKEERFIQKLMTKYSMNEAQVLSILRDHSSHFISTDDNVSVAPNDADDRSSVCSSFSSVSVVSLSSAAAGMIRGKNLSKRPATTSPIPMPIKETVAPSYHTRIAAIYSKHCPEKLQGISSLLRHKQVKGKEERFIQKLMTKYNVTTKELGELILHQGSVQPASESPPPVRDVSLLSASFASTVALNNDDKENVHKASSSPIQTANGTKTTLTLHTKTVLGESVHSANKDNRVQTWLQDSQPQ